VVNGIGWQWSVTLGRNQARELSAIRTLPLQPTAHIRLRLPLYGDRLYPYSSSQ
jgi:hypothetical protein